MELGLVRYLLLCLLSWFPRPQFKSEPHVHIPFFNYGITIVLLLPDHSFVITLQKAKKCIG